MALKTKQFLANNNKLPTKHYQCEWTNEMIKEMEVSKNDIIHFAENHFYITNVDRGKEKIRLYDCQLKILKSFVDNRFIAVCASRQVGKCLALNTPIPTPKGWTIMGELKKGDYVYGSSGSPVKVLHAHDILYNQECFEIEFSNGEKIIADKDHRWFTQSRTERKRKCKGSVKTTKEILDTLTIGKKVIESAHRINIKHCVKYYKKKLLIDPYLFGMWLGDGAKSSNVITMGKDDYEEMYNESLSHINNKTIIKDKNKTTRTVKIQKFDDGEYFRTKLKKLNVFNNKHIPVEYLQSSISQRIELLKGLMDTDGHVNKRGICQFYTINKKLRDNVKELLWSLGIQCSITSKIPKIGNKKYNKCYILTFKTNLTVFKLKRKLNRLDLIENNNRNKFIYIKNIKLVESVPVRCITVDSEDSLFLCGRTFIPTHNTVMLTIFALWMASFNKDENIFILANKEETAKMILERVRMAYEEMENWIKPPIKEFTKSALVFENGSAIRTSTTSSQSIRGQSVSCVDGDSMVTIKDKNNGNVFDISMKNLSDILEKDGEILSYKIIEE